jgi:hypothetical protein
VRLPCAITVSPVCHRCSDVTNVSRTSPSRPTSSNLYATVALRSRSGPDRRGQLNAIRECA